MENSRENLQMHQAFFDQDPPDYEAYLLDLQRQEIERLVPPMINHAVFRERLNGELRFRAIERVLRQVHQQQEPFAGRTILIRVSKICRVLADIIIILFAFFFFWFSLNFNNEETN